MQASSFAHDTYEEVIRLVAESCDANPADVRRDRALVEYGLDSARAVDLLVSLEEAFHIQIPDDVAASLRTVDDIVAYVGERTAR